MPDFTIYNPATGQILSTGTARDIHSQAEDGQSVIEGRSDPRTQRVVDGKLRMIPKRERDARLKERTLRKLRGRRDRILRDIDWRFGAAHWASLTEAEKQAWQDYRQALLDLPETIDLDDPVWPVPPQMNKEAKT
jgi:hypothetical protein